MGRVCSSLGRSCSHSGCGLEFQEKKLGSLKRESRRPVSGRVKVSGADFFLGLSLGTDRKSGASVERGVDGALLGPLRALDASCVSEMEMAGGNVPILRLVACCVARSYSLTSSMVISDGDKVNLDQLMTKPEQLLLFMYQTLDQDHKLFTVIAVKYQVTHI